MFSYFIILVTIFQYFDSTLAQRLVSPCPAWFTYDPEGIIGDRWWGTIKITPDAEYAGLWLRVEFDNAVGELGTNFGEAVKREPNEFLIRNPKHRLLEGETQRIRIFARFPSGWATPHLTGLRLNGKVVCPENTSRFDFVSPCPRFFRYEPPGNDTDRWHGILDIQSDRDLQGVWVRIILDRPSVQLGVSEENWFGEVTTDDNKEYLIKNRDTQVRPGEIVPIRFFVKYNPSEPIPKLESYRINADSVCPENIGGSSSGNSGGNSGGNNGNSGGNSGNSGGNSGSVNGLNNRDRDSSTSSSSRPQTSRPQTRPQGTTDRNRPSFQSTTERKPVWIKPDTGPKPDTTIYGSDFDPQSRPGFLPGKHESPNRQPPCGTVVAMPRPLITRGEVTGEAQFPWHAALYYPKGIDLQYICGASLISLKHVLTAAHCVTKRSTDQPVNNNDVQVFLGKYFLRNFASKEIQSSQVSRVIVHPEYNHRYYANDIAILALANPVEYTDYVRPVCLWSGPSDINDIVEKEGTVVGWGYDETGKVNEKLTKAPMPVVSHAKCIWSYPEFFSKFSNPKSFCAGYRNGTSVCNGDSGGGIVFAKPESSPNQPVWQVRGVVSISVALQSEFVCDTSHYAIFTDAAKYTDWIKSNIV